MGDFVVKVLIFLINFLVRRYFAGLHCLDLSSMAWKSQETTGPAPLSRMAHQAVLMDHSLIIHGGFNLPPGELPAVITYHLDWF